MRELNIAVNKQDIDYLYYLKQNIDSKKIKLYCAICEINDMAIFSLATKDEDFSYVSAKLKQLVADVVLYIYKEKFLENKINLQNLTENYKVALLKALVLFDSESDKQIIKTKLNFDTDLYLESFVNFKLNPLKKRWQEIANLANENDVNVLQNDTFLDLLKFLIATIKPKTNIVNVYYINGEFIFKDGKQKNIKGSMVTMGSDEINLITSLITLAPNNINFHCIDAISNNTFKVLFYIFDKKVNLLV